MFCIEYFLRLVTEKTVVLKSAIDLRLSKAVGIFRSHKLLVADDLLVLKASLLDLERC